jgi:ankyrin repeat protein
VHKKIKVPQPINEPHVIGIYPTPRYPLDYAIGQYDADMVEAFLEAGANPNIDIYNGWTPLHKAFDRALDGMNQESRDTPDPGIIKIIKLLLKHGASFDNVDARGLKPLDIINEYAYNRDGFNTILTFFKPVIPNIAELIPYNGYIKD